LAASFAISFRFLAVIPAPSRASGGVLSQLAILAIMVALPMASSGRLRLSGFVAF
jgi:hypothetical protein